MNVRHGHKFTIKTAILHHVQLFVRELKPIEGLKQDGSVRSVEVETLDEELEEFEAIGGMMRLTDQTIEDRKRDSSDSRIPEEN
jgi:hypothetical protein